MGVRWGGRREKLEARARGEGRWCCARTDKLPQHHYSLLLPRLSRLVIDLLQLLQYVLDDRRRPQARLLVNEGRRPQDALQNLCGEASRCSRGIASVAGREWQLPSISSPWPSRSGSPRRRPCPWRALSQPSAASTTHNGVEGWGGRVAGRFCFGRFFNASIRPKSLRRVQHTTTTSQI